MGQVEKIKENLRKYILDYVPLVFNIVARGIGKDREGWFVFVDIAKKLPKGAVLPSHFAGVRVISQVVRKNYCKE